MRWRGVSGWVSGAACATSGISRSCALGTWSTTCRALDDEEGLGVRRVEHHDRSGDGAEHRRIVNGGDFILRHHLLEQVEQAWDVAPRCFEVASVLGDGGLLVGEGKPANARLAAVSLPSAANSPVWASASSTSACVCSSNQAGRDGLEGGQRGHLTGGFTISRECGEAAKGFSVCHPVPVSSLRSSVPPVA